MPVPEFYCFCRPILEVLDDSQPRHWTEIAQAAAQKLNLTEQDLEEPIAEGGKTRIQVRVPWALTYLRQAGLIEPVARGTSRITEIGHTYLKTAPKVIRPGDLMQFPSYAAFQGRSRKVINLEAATASNPSLVLSSNDILTIASETTTPEESIADSFLRHREALAAEVLEQVKAMSPAFFEQLIVRLMLRLGYGRSEDAGQVLGRSGDGGVDGVISQDKLGLEKIYLQAKRWTENTVGRGEIQAFVGALAGQGANKGVFITTSSFSREATDFARHNHGFKISLVDGRHLALLMIEHDLGVSLVERYDVKRVDSDFFSEN